jgi:hypothetical protein
MSEQDQPSFAALIGSLFAAADALVIGGTVFPGLLLCVPGIAFFALPILVAGLLLLVVVVVPIALVFGLVAGGRLVARQVRRRIPAPRARVAAPERGTGRLVVLAERGADRHV